MDRVSVRLELAKLTYRPTHNGAIDAVAASRELEKYILEPGPDEAEKKPAELVSNLAPAPKEKSNGKNKKSDNSVFD